MLRGTIFDITTADLLVEPSNSRIFGSCLFELASVLKLLPGQYRANLLETESSTLHEMFYDKDTYYGKCSRESLFRLVTQHFVSIRESSGHLIVHTAISVFTFIQTDRRLLVRVNGNERATGVLVPENQNYLALKQCTAGLWCVREGDEVSLKAGEYLKRGTVKNWTGSINVDTLILTQSIEHHTCLYFLPHETFQRL